MFTPLSSVSSVQALQVAPPRFVWAHPRLPLHHLWVKDPKLEMNKNKETKNKDAKSHAISLQVPTLNNEHISVQTDFQFYLFQTSQVHWYC